MLCDHPVPQMESSSNEKRICNFLQTSEIYAAWEAKVEKLVRKTVSHAP